MSRSRHVPRAGLIVAAAAVVAAASSRNALLHARALRGGGTVRVDEAIGTTAALALWVVIGWLAVSVALGVAAALPRAAGTAAARLATAITPRVVRRLVVCAVGATIAGGASPALAATGIGSAGAGPASTGGVGPVPFSSASAAPALSASPGWRAPAQDDDWPLLDRPTARAVVVQPGDCLWSIAAARLGRDATAEQIAAEWPRWYAANRAVIGPDPDLVRPGQRLVEPQ